MRILSVTAIAAFTLGLTLAGSAPVAAQLRPANSNKPILGYQDPETGEFKPLVRAVPDVTTISPTTGTVELTLTITLKTALPKGGTIVCGANLTATSVNMSTASYGYWYEQSYATATVSGSTATCTVNVPYSWVVPKASATVENAVTANYEIEMLDAAATTQLSTIFPAGTARYSSGTFYSGAIPTSGTISKYAVSAVL